MKLFLKHLTQCDDEPGNNTSQWAIFNSKERKI